MSATTQVTDFSDLYTDLQNRVRVATSITATENQAKRYINSALHDIHMNYDYRYAWTERSAVLRTHAPYTTGTVSVSVGSTALAGSSTLWITDNSYGEDNARTTGKLTISGGTDIYRISTVTDDTNIVLTDRYVASAAASGATYTYFEDEYALASDFLRPIDMQFFSQAWTIPLVSRLEFRRAYPRPNVSGRPAVASIIDLATSSSTTPRRLIKFYPYPSDVFLIPYNYVSSYLARPSAGVEQAALSSNSDEPIMPLRYRHIIVLHALYNWFRDKRDDQRSQEVKAEYTDAMLRMVADVEIGTHNKAQIQPRLGGYWGHARRPYASASGSRYSVNDSFDRLEDRNR